MMVWAPQGVYPGKYSLDMSPSKCWPVSFPRDHHYITLHDGPTPPDELVAAVATHTFVGHNAMRFDAPALERFFGWTPPWKDTLPLARAAGLPGGLDAIGKQLFGIGKAADVKLMYSAKVKGDRVVYPVGTLAIWETLLSYNVGDVLLLERIWQEVLQYEEAEVINTDRAINARGIRVNTAYVRRLCEVWDALETQAEEVFKAKTGGINVRSVPQVRAWLESRGLNMSSLNRLEVERMLDAPEELDGVEGLEEVTEVLKLRQTCTRTGKAKLASLLQAVDDDGRVRDTILYHKAHTGRFSSGGRGSVQIHNLPKGVPSFDTESLIEGDLTVDRIRAVCEAYPAMWLEKTGEVVPVPSLDDAITSLVRPVFYGGSIADYAGIEARGVAWCAGEDELLELFRQRRDPYCVIASVIFGRQITKANPVERKVGKETQLGSGYSMSHQKFAAYCKTHNIDLVAAGTTAEVCVNAFRDKWTKIAGVKQGQWRRGGLWKDLQAAAFSAVLNGGEHNAGRCTFFMRGTSLLIRLPSGRCLVYRSASIQPRVPSYCALLGIPLVPRPTLVYLSPHGYESSLYGGKLAENVVQAICRDLLVDAMVRCDRLGLPVCFHVHDELVCESEQIDDLCAVMSTPPAWAEGFPIMVEGYTCPVYSKSPFKGSRHVTAIDGVIV